MACSVFVDGQEGTTGLRIFEYLGKRQDIELIKIDPDRRKDLQARRELLNAADVAFLCLPDAAARESVALVDNPNTCIIDASTAHRTDPSWVYGLPELAPEQRQRLRHQKRISVPGCHATAFVLLAYPLVQGGLLPADQPLAAHSITGYSGGGKKMIEHYQQSQDPRLQSPRAYSLGLQHKHLPEMTLHSGLRVAPVFTPIVANFYQGLAVTIFLPAQQIGLDPQQIQAHLAGYYAGEPCVRVMPLNDEANLDQGYFDVQSCNDTNRVDLFVFGSAQRAVLMARLDNLGKGASGAAVQCLNVHLGLDELTGLSSGLLGREE